MKIVKLTVENVMRISAVEITPEGSVVVIGGKNGAGKTSVLAAIEMALGGKDHAVEEPVRKGEARGRIVVDLGEILVERVFAAGGASKLAVRAASGAIFPSPQAMLDHLVGKLAFDPLSFARAREKEQTAILRSVVKLDTTELDNQRIDLFTRRTDVNRDAERFKKHLEAMERLPEGADVPEVESDPAELLRQLEAMQGRNVAREALKAEAEAEKQRGNEIFARREALSQRMRELASELNRITVEHDRQHAYYEQSISNLGIAQRKAEQARAEVEPTDDLRKRIADCQRLNALVRLSKARKLAEQQYQGSAALSAEMTSAMAHIDDAKRRMVEEAKFPIDGLSFDGDRVMLNGLPFSQASGAEQLRASIAIGMTLNPKLKVLIARDGSLLDEDGLALLAEIADQHGFQVWLERVGRGTEVSFLIEDGQVAWPPPEMAESEEAVQ